MPALLPVPGVARVVYNGVFGTASWANILHVSGFDSVGIRIDDAWTPAEIDALSLFMSARWLARFAPQVNTSVTLVNTECTDLTSEFGEVSIDATNRVGTLAGAQFPAQVSCCVSWREALHYRGGHPRTYLPPATVNQQSTAQRFTTVYAQAVEAAMNGLITDLQASAIRGGTTHLELVAVHRTRNHAVLNPPLPIIISAATVDARIDTQRRRLGPDE